MTIQARPRTTGPSGLSHWSLRDRTAEEPGGFVAIASGLSSQGTRESAARAVLQVALPD